MTKVYPSWKIKFDMFVSHFNTKYSDMSWWHCYKIKITISWLQCIPILNLPIDQPDRPLKDNLHTIGFLNVLGVTKQQRNLNP